MAEKYPKEAVYNKLVRDRIPEIISENGSKSETKILTKEETIKLLKEKSLEESQELVAAEDLKETKKEMSDILEILTSLAEELEIDMDEIEKLRQMRAEKRGRFKKRTYLIRTKAKKK